MSKIRVATCVPKQCWMQAEKLEWLDQAIAKNPCELFVTSQEFVGGGSTREICRRRNIKTDDFPVTEEWILTHVGELCRKHSVHIGFGATVQRDGINTEDFLYLDPAGTIVGYHSKIALPRVDDINTDGASQVTPEADYERAARVIDIPDLGLRVATVFCWQVFFSQFWVKLMQQRCTLVVHPIKFAPRAWYKNGKTSEELRTRIGYQQNPGSDREEDDALGWIRKLKYESEFRQVPIACSCNTWAAGKKYLALVGWVDEVVSSNTKLLHLPSTAETDAVMVTEYDPALLAMLPKFHRGLYPHFKDSPEGKRTYNAIMRKGMMRKALRYEERVLEAMAENQVSAAPVKYKGEPGPIEGTTPEDVFAGSLPPFFEDEAINSITPTP